MQATDKKRFLTVLTGIADYYGKVLSESVIGLYWQGLQQYDLSAVEKALWEHTQNPDSGQFMPKIADVTRVLQGRTQDQAAIAWSKVDAAVRHVGPHSDVVFDDPLIHRVIADMGGWAWFGRQTDDEWPFVARNFENRYRGYRLQGDTPEYPAILHGTSNAQNQLQGFHAQPPRLIGNPEAARIVMQGGCSGPLIQVSGIGEKVVPIDQKRLAAR